MARKLTSAIRLFHGAFSRNLLVPPAAATIAAFALLGCGGGGSADSSAAAASEAPVSAAQPSPQPQPGAESGTPATQINYVDVALTLVAPTSGIMIDTEEGAVLPAQSFKFKASGNLESTEADKLFLIIEDKNLLLKNEGAQTFVDDQAETIEFKFSGTQAKDAGIYESIFTIYACADEKCEKQYQGSPYKVPYKLNVRKSIALSASEVVALAPFGTKPASQTVEITLPPNVTTDNLTITERDFLPIFNGMYISKAAKPPVKLTVVKEPASQKANVVVDFDAMSAGTYTAGFDIAVVENSVPGTPRYAYTLKRVNIKYTATSDGVRRYVLSPQQLTFKSDYSGMHKNPDGAAYNVYVDKGVELGDPTMTYLESPALAADHPRLNNWFNASAALNRSSAYQQPVMDILSVCRNSYEIPNVTYYFQCLPSGDYTGTINQPIKIDGHMEYLSIPVIMQR